MLLLIHDRDRWELPEPEPEAKPTRRELRIARPSRATIKLLLALLLLIAGALTSGIAGDVLMFAAVLAVGSAVASAMPYGLGLREHHQ